MVLKFCKEIWKLRMSKQMILYHNIFIWQSSQGKSRISRLNVMTQTISCCYFILMWPRNGRVTYCWSLWNKDDHWHSSKRTAEKHTSTASCLQAMHVLTALSPWFLALRKYLQWMSRETIRWIIWETWMHFLKSLLKRQKRLLLGAMVPRILWPWLK